MTASCHRHTGCRAPRAFTLVEVLAAIAIMAIVLPIIMSGLSLATSAASIAKRRTQATSLAQMKLDELLVTRDFAILSGEFTDHPDYRWNLELATWDSGTTGGITTSVDRLDVSVIWLQRGKEYKVTLSTLLYSSSSSSSPFDMGGSLLP